jgi:hypothetical protein
MDSKPLSSKEQAKLKGVAVTAMAAFIFFSYVGYIGVMGIVDSNEDKSGQVQGVTTSDSNEITNQAYSPDTDKLRFAVNNTTAGMAFVELHLDEPMNIDRVALDLKIDGDLLITDFVCADKVACTISTYDDESIYLIAENTDTTGSFFNGRVILATIYYDPETSAELVANSEGQGSSRIYVKGSVSNYMGPETQYYPIGRKAL